MKYLRCEMCGKTFSLERLRMLEIQGCEDRQDIRHVFRLCDGCETDVVRYIYKRKMLDILADD